MCVNCGRSKCHLKKSPRPSENVSSLRTHTTSHPRTYGRGRMLSSLFPEFYNLNTAIAFITQHVAVICLQGTVPIIPNQSSRSRRRHSIWSLLRTISSMNEGPRLKVNSQSIKRSSSWTSYFCVNNDTGEWSKQDICRIRFSSLWGRGLRCMFHMTPNSGNS